MRLRKLGAAGVTVAAAAVGAAFIAGGVGSAAAGTAAKRSGSARAIVAAGPPGIYLKATGILGEVIDPGYTNQMAVTDYSFHQTNANGTAKVAFDDMEVHIANDRSVPQFENLMNVGTPIANVTLTVVNSAGNKVRSIVLTNARLTSISYDDTPSDPSPADLKFSFDQEAQYYYYRSSTGTTTTYKSCWNQFSNTKCTG